jgi:hypothetical protein
MRMGIGGKKHIQPDAAAAGQLTDKLDGLIMTS